ncbi:hypothetical protein NNL21_34960 [Paenibacillus mendelii]|nr:hypothetical protein [Paenibacillus mendelii]
MVSRISYICDLPMKSVGELLCRDGFQSRKMLEEIRVYFRRDLVYEDNHYCFGDSTKDPFRIEDIGSQRLFMKFYEFEHQRFAALAYALDCSVAMATSLLIRTAIKRKDIMYPILGDQIRKDLDIKRTKQLRELCRFLDARSPDDFITIPVMLAHAIDKCVQEGKKVKRTLQEWIQ